MDNISMLLVMALFLLELISSEILRRKVNKLNDQVDELKHQLNIQEESKL